MTDNDIIRVLYQIKQMCKQRSSYEPFVPMCRGCVFEVYKPSKRKNVCQISMFLGRLTCHPYLWDMEDIREVIEK